jgi:hypothetical protein
MLVLRGEEIEDVAEHAPVCPEELRVFAASTRHGRKLRAFDVEHFAQDAARNVDFPDFTFTVAAAKALEVVEFSHVASLSHLTSPDARAHGSTQIGLT